MGQVPVQLGSTRALGIQIKIQMPSAESGWHLWPNHKATPGQPNRTFLFGDFTLAVPHFFWHKDSILAYRNCACSAPGRA